MDNNDVVKLCEKEIEIFLGTMNIFRGNRICNTDTNINKANRDFIISQMMRMKAGNIDRDILEKAVDNILPYLYEK